MQVIQLNTAFVPSVFTWILVPMSAHSFLTYFSYVSHDIPYLERYASNTYSDTKF